MEQWMDNLLLAAFFFYLATSIMFFAAATSSAATPRPNGNKNEERRPWQRWAVVSLSIGLLLHISSWVIRWIVNETFPISNLFEFFSFLCLTITLLLLFLLRVYPAAAASLGSIVMALVTAFMAYAVVTLPRDIMPLPPALQSYWRWIHVPSACVGSAAFIVGSMAGVLYLLRTLDPAQSSSRKVRYLEVFWWSCLSWIGSVLMFYVGKVLGYQAHFEYIAEDGQAQDITYRFPALLGPSGGLTDASADFWHGIWIEVPSFWGADRVSQANTFVWALLVGGVLYGILRFVARKPLSLVLRSRVQYLSPDRLDELEYRAIVMGLPIFALGALFFASIWAEQAWGRFWGWDAKEVWAAVTFGFYSVYLHFRLSRGWHGTRSAWLSIAGLSIVLFNLLFVNLVIPGLHSYAG
ncbi:c-type cytochrome biogenesis protein CcsB [Pasteuria penetrans]|uniref:c-type cytochrome biogenesis protein CcsB n=1 Tax=Pasteuria penetrans TaxID=86005 RepID=UPI000F9B0DC3|nr:c-type cytochrome biogenesis protein CcsB [Pasteuria penetrans]